MIRRTEGRSHESVHHRTGGEPSPRPHGQCPRALAGTNCSAHWLNAVPDRVKGLPSTTQITNRIETDIVHRHRKDLLIQCEPTRAETQTPSSGAPATADPDRRTRRPRLPHQRFLSIFSASRHGHPRRATGCRLLSPNRYGVIRRGEIVESVSTSTVAVALQFRGVVRRVAVGRAACSVG
ncbi:MAG: hypothetical protein QOH07_2028 [Mycobacterium sp.]|nr:hypothetical protein [Mycobacterium sp.]